MLQVESQNRPRETRVLPPTGKRRQAHFFSLLSSVPIVLDQQVADKQSAISSCCRSTGCSCILPTHLAQNKEHLIRLLVTCVSRPREPQRCEDFPRPDSILYVCTVCLCIWCIYRAISRWKHTLHYKYATSRVELVCLLCLEAKLKLNDQSAAKPLISAVDTVSKSRQDENDSWIIRVKRSSRGRKETEVNWFYGVLVKIESLVSI